MSKKRVRAPDWKEMRRYRALELKREGWTLEEIAEALDVSTRYVKKWMKAVREEGEIGLQARPHLGVPPRLPAEELALLPELLAAGAEAYGSRRGLDECARGDSHRMGVRGFIPQSPRLTTAQEVDS